MQRLWIYGTCLLLVTLSVPALEAETVGSCPSTPPVVEDRFIQPGKTVLRSQSSITGCIISPGSSCGIGFLLNDSANAIYATSGGHCFRNPSSGGRTTYAMHPVYGAWGEVLYSAPSPNEQQIPDRDIAIIKVFPEFYDSVDPAVAIWGGPTGTTADFPQLIGLREEQYSPTNPPTSPSDVSLVAHYGLPGAAAGYPAGLPRVGLLITMNADHYLCVCATAGGDSGSPSIDLRTGAALGLHHSGTPAIDQTGEGCPCLVPSYDPDWPRATTGVNFSKELEHLKTVKKDAKQRDVNWSSLKLMPAPLSEYSRVVAGIA